MDSGVLLALAGAGIAVGVIVSLVLIKRRNSAEAAQPVPRAATSTSLRATGRNDPMTSGSSWLAEMQIKPDQSLGAWLVIMRGPERGNSYRLAERTMTIGRSVSNFVQLSDLNVSRIHCQVRWTRSGFQVVDMTSANGTQLNGVTITDIRFLNDGDVIRVGDSELRFEAKGSYAVDHALGRKDASKGSSVATNYVTVADSGDTMLSMDAARKRLLDMSDLVVKVQRGMPREQIIQEVGKFLFEHIKMDRVFVLQIASDGGWQIERSLVDQKVDATHKNAKPDRYLLSSVVQAMELLTSQGSGLDSGGCGPALAAPLVEDGVLTGILYADRVSEGGPPLQQASLQLVEGLAGLLRAK